MIHVKIDTRQIFKDYEDKEVTENVYDEEKKENKKEPLTVKKVFTNAINSFMPNELQTSEEKAKIFGLSTKLYSQHDPDFTVNDLAFIKEKVGKYYNALIFGRTCEIIDGKAEQKEVK